MCYHTHQILLPVPALLRANTSYSNSKSFVQGPRHHGGQGAMANNNFQIGLYVLCPNLKPVLVLAPNLKPVLVLAPNLKPVLVLASQSQTCIGPGPQSQTRIDPGPPISNPYWSTPRPLQC